jgi:DNA-binding response OmpR family regulator
MRSDLRGPMNVLKQLRRRPSKGPHVVVVEDDPLLSLTLEEALHRAGAGRVTACSAMTAAVETLEKGRVDALVLDVHLADRDDGWALAELAAVLGSRKPVIAFSTGTPEAIPDTVRSLGPVYAKPYDPDVLADEVLSSVTTGLVRRLRGALR